jgi:hypothetical protein
MAMAHDEAFILTRVEERIRGWKSISYANGVIKAARVPRSATAASSRATALEYKRKMILTLLVSSYPAQDKKPNKIKVSWLFPAQGNLMLSMTPNGMWRYIWRYFVLIQ